jgi:RNA 2',3'-cyclic 3'-phosphodiesterase
VSAGETADGDADAGDANATDARASAASARLFVALPLPAAVTGALARMAPAPGPGVRPIAEADMHLTLHFLGRADPATVGRAIAALRLPAFEVRLNGPGHFSLRGHKTILWVGVETSAALLDLHAMLGEALAATGFVPETRPYVPHITVARLGPAAAHHAVRDFESASYPAGAAAFVAGRFALFASETAPEGARYRMLATVALDAGD